MKRRAVKKSKFDFSIFNKKPIIKNGYVMALLVFVALVVVFNIADSYDSYGGDEVTGMAAYESLLDPNMFKTIGSAFQTVLDIFFGFSIVIFRIFGENLNVVAIKLALAVLVFLAIRVPAIKKFGHKNGSIVAGIISIAGIALIPENIIGNLFGAQGSLIRAIVVLLSFVALIFFPLKGMYKWEAVDWMDKVLKLLAYLILLLAFIFFDGVFRSGVTVGGPEFVDLAYILVFSLGLVWCAVGIIAQIFGFAGAAERGATRETGRRVGAAVRPRVGNFFNFLKGTGEGWKGDDEREKLARVDKLANKFANALKHAIAKGRPQKDSGKILSRYLSEAGRIGVGSRKAKQIINSKGIRV